MIARKFNVHSNPSLDFSTGVMIHNLLIFHIFAGTVSVNRVAGCGLAKSPSPSSLRQKVTASPEFVIDQKRSESCLVEATTSKEWLDLLQSNRLSKCQKSPTHFTCLASTPKNAICGDAKSSGIIGDASRNSHQMDRLNPTWHDTSYRNDWSFSCNPPPKVPMPKAKRLRKWLLLPAKFSRMGKSQLSILCWKHHKTDNMTVSLVCA